MIELILGGVRSGKSRYAEKKIKSAAYSHYKNVIYIATATANDDEMLQRIKRHQQERPAHWQLIEEPIRLARVLQRNNNNETIILIECLTLWLTNLLCAEDEQLLMHEKKLFVEQMKNTQAHIMMVSNETGLGVIPMGALSRRFVDESGVLHQQLAAISDNVILVVAGLEHRLKSAD